MRDLILLSNDDSIFSDGIRTLAIELESVGFEVVIVAPMTEQSAKSHGLTLDRPLRVRDLGTLKTTDVKMFGIDGTPADTIYVALVGEGFLSRRPKFVVSGINHGYNLGADTFYSGTVAAAREAALRGFCAFAFSAGPEANMLACAKWAARIMQAAPAHEASLYNVNFPANRSDFVGVRTCSLGARYYDDEVAIRHDPRGREYVWIGGPGARHEPAAGSDTEACDAGYISLTPLSLDQTARTEIESCGWVARV